MDGISVNKKYRGKGIGGMLLNKVKEYALQNRFSRIRLDVTAITTGQHEWTKQQKNSAQ